MSKVALVTDSTSYIPKEIREKYPITVVPQVVIWEGQTYEDDVTITPAQFYTRLRTAKVMPSTSQASVVNMHKAFSTLLEQGYDVLGIFVSAKLSGTFQSASLGREQLTSGKEKVDFIDSETTAMAMGFMVLQVARAAQEGASLADCKALAEKARNHVGVYLTVETLEFLHRGGRIGGAQRFLGTALNLKPILAIQDGRVEAVERVRTRGKALDRVVELVVEKCAGKTPIRLATLHADSESDARIMLDKIAPMVNPVESVFASVSPAVGANAGPGTVGLAWMAGM
ncbi:MAG TPA: DegV family protein [Anaerolineales bacterium]|nr:DegV family protein [Anaerolineales bacterium]